MKAKYDLYVQKDLQELFDKEPNMSGLINNLLREHYGKVQEKVKDFATVGIKTTTELVHTGTGLATIITPDKKDVKAFKVKLSKDKLLNGLCKIHEVPLDSRGKCLQKGCKYA